MYIHVYDSEQMKIKPDSYERPDQFICIDEGYIGQFVYMTKKLVVIKPSCQVKKPFFKNDYV